MYTTYLHVHVYIQHIYMYMYLYIIQERVQVYPPPDPSQPQLLTLLQVRLLKKLGRNAYPFTFSVSDDECVMTSV